MLYVHEYNGLWREICRILSYLVFMCSWSGHQKFSWDTPQNTNLTVFTFQSISDFCGVSQRRSLGSLCVFIYSVYCTKRFTMSNRTHKVSCIRHNSMDATRDEETVDSDKYLHAAHPRWYLDRTWSITDDSTAWAFPAAEDLFDVGKRDRSVILIQSSIMWSPANWDSWLWAKWTKVGSAWEQHWVR